MTTTTQHRNDPEVNRLEAAAFYARMARLVAQPERFRVMAERARLNPVLVIGTTTDFSRRRDARSKLNREAKDTQARHFQAHLQPYVDDATRAALPAPSFTRPANVRSGAASRAVWSRRITERTEKVLRRIQRDVPFPQWLAVRPGYGPERGEAPGPYVFPGYSGELRPVGGMTIERAMAIAVRVLDECGGVWPVQESPFAYLDLRS